MARFATSETTIGFVCVICEETAWFLPIGSVNHRNDNKMSFDKFKELYPIRIGSNHHRSKK